MFIIKFLFAFVITALLAVPIQAQKIDDWVIKKIDSSALNCINYSRNNFENTNTMYPLLGKLYKIKHFSKENAVFVHIGDSHIQADVATSVIRNELQSYFGNAGRGLVFPYQVGKSNAPYDVVSSSKSSWKSNRLARTDTLITCGVSAFGMQSQSSNPEFNLELQSINGIRDNFDKVHLFMGGPVSELYMEYNDTQAENSCFTLSPDYTVFNLKSPAFGFHLTFPTNDTIRFYGASLEKNASCGIIYHNIGANGAKYSDYNKTKQFWKQLNKLDADCYIVSLGTNEAQDPNLTADKFLKEVQIMVSKLRLISPNACIILTTPPVSYFKKSNLNFSLEVITCALTEYCNSNNLVYWDLFTISKGLEGAKIWKKKQLLRQDLVHFSKEGYVLQGNLFVDAFAKLWNEFLCKNY
ncbi:GDSL-type esterase/lipase family protein [Flavobacterium sp.]|uniref:GDSL-type esterase/lipase family protein n=1 Tax=Flavobacterium sp. TaxID=239 RepID=UPI003BD9BAC8